MSSSDVKRLVQMGINRAVAVAALAKCKDVEDAAEAIFAGKFAHIAEESDGEGSSQLAESYEEDEDVDDSISLADDDEELVDPDPYRDVGLVEKGATETIIENEDDDTTPVTLASGAVAHKLSLANFMKGPSVGAEQQHLFGLYQRLQEDIACPKCRKKRTRTDAESLLVLCPTIDEFVAHLGKNAVCQCKCGTVICTACGGTSTQSAPANEIEEIGKSEFEAKGKAKGKDKGKRPESAVRHPRPTGQATSTAELAELSLLADPALLHCGEMQAVVLGAGLAHIERALETQDRSDTPSSNGGQKRPRSDSAPQAGGSTKKKAKAGNNFLDGSTDGSYGSDDSSDEYDYNYMHPAAHKGNSKGTGYAGSSGANEHGWIEAQKKKEQEADSALHLALMQLRPYLPMTFREPNPASSDYMPDACSIAAIRRRLLPIASRLLRSDSLSDMVERYDLYFEMLQWFRTLSLHESLSALLAQPVMLRRDVKIIEKKKKRERHVTYECSEGPRQRAESILVQTEAFLESMKRNEAQIERERLARRRAKGGDEEERPRSPSPIEYDPLSQKLVAFCESFKRNVATIDANLAKTKGDAFLAALLGNVTSSSSNAPPPAHVGSQTRSKTARKAVPTPEEAAKEAAKAYEAWAEGQRMEHVDMSVPAAAVKEGEAEAKPTWLHVFSNEVNNVNASDNPKRGLIIAKELSAMRNSLPSGTIFLRVDESRIDLIKACLVGPEGSPYHLGLFFLDIFLPSEYNHLPPKAKIVTTSGGQIRMGPNLYAEGKICLSLLGTWSGPGWASGRSTLLQILLSVQSMILGVTDPMTLEPGYENLEGSPGSVAYSRNTRRQTVRVAMLEQLQNPPACWEDFVPAFYKLRADEVIKQLDAWSADDDGGQLHKDGMSAGGHAYHPHAGAGAAGAKPAAKAPVKPGVETPLRTDIARLKEALAKLRE